MLLPSSGIVAPPSVGPARWAELLAGLPPARAGSELGARLVLRDALAGQMRDHVRDRLQAGESPEQIKAYLESRYGDFVLMEPPKHGLNWLLWLGPFALLGIGALLLRRSLTRWRKPVSTAETAAVSDEQKRKIEAELAKLEDE